MIVTTDISWGINPEGMAYIRRHDTPSGLGICNPRFYNPFIPSGLESALTSRLRSISHASHHVEIEIAGDEVGQ